MGLLIYPIGALKEEKSQLNAYGIMVNQSKELIQGEKNDKWN
jgi:hypothetical protein